MFTLLARSKFLAAALLLVIFNLTGCASLSKNECLSADWFDIGMRDGANGRAEEYIVNHAAACQRVDVTPDRELWHDGRNRGLNRYCTVRNGYSVAAGGGGYGGVCVAHDEPGFLHGFDLGRDVYLMHSRLTSIESDIYEAQKARKAENLEPKECERLDQRLRELEFQRGIAQRDYDAAQWRAQDSLGS